MGQFCTVVILGRQGSAGQLGVNRNNTISGNVYFKTSVENEEKQTTVCKGIRILMELSCSLNSICDFPIEFCLYLRN